MLPAQNPGRKMPPRYERGDYVPRLVHALDTEQVCLSLESYAGRFTLLAFIGSVNLPEVRKLIRTLSIIKHFFGKSGVQFLGVGQGIGALRQEFKSSLNMAFIDDPEFRISGAFGAMRVDDLAELRTSFTPLWMILDPNLRVVDVFPLNSADIAFETFMAFAAGSGASTSAPILTHPRVFEPSFCEALINAHSEKTTPFEPNQDISLAALEDLPMRVAVLERLERRLVPEVIKYSNVTPATIQNLIFIRRKAGEGNLEPSRLNFPSTAGKRALFAVWVPLDNEIGFGGGVVFPEYGSSVISPSIGSALVHSTAMLRQITQVSESSRYFIECLMA